MSLLTSKTTLTLWQEVIKHAENRCSISLQQDLEAYLVALVMRYANRPELAKQIFAKAFMEALQLRENERLVSLQEVGDQCLLFAGLFPKAAEKKQVKISYFVDIGRTAYSSISNTSNDLYGLLALEFVVLMDVLQSIRVTPDLMPLEAYEQWQEVGSQRALKLLEEYSKGIPLKFIKQ